MVKLQHQTRRGGPGSGEVVLVGGEKYELDAEGCVEVSEEHAELLQQGSKWKTPGAWGDQSAAIKAATPEIISGARRARTPEEMQAVAESEGLSYQASKPAEPPAPEPESEPETEEEPEAEEVEISMAMKRSELVEIAESYGVDTNGMTKAEIIDALQAEGD